MESEYPAKESGLMKMEVDESGLQEHSPSFWRKPVVSEDVKDCTELFLLLYSSNTIQNMFKNKDGKQINVWIKLAQLMEENGHPIPSSSCLDAGLKAKRKLFSLKKEYFEYIQNLNQTKSVKKPTPKYFSLLEEIFGGRDHNPPQFPEDTPSPSTYSTTASPSPRVESLKERMKHSRVSSQLSESISRFLANEAGIPEETKQKREEMRQQKYEDPLEQAKKFWAKPVASEDVEDCTELILKLYSTDTVQNLLKNKEVKLISAWMKLAQLMEENGHPIPSSSRLDAAMKAERKINNLRRKYVTFINIPKQTGVEENPTPKYFNLLEETFSRNIQPQFSEDILSPNTCPTSTACPTTVTITPSSPTTTQSTPTKSKCTPSFWKNPVVSEDVEDCTELFLLLYSSDTIQNLLKNKEVKQIRAWIRLAQLMEENGHPIPSSSRLDAALKAKQKFFNLKRKYVNFIKNPKQIGAKGNRRPKYFQLLKETFSGNIYSELSEDTSSVNFIKNPKQTGARGNRRPKYFHLRKKTFSGNSELSEDTLSPNTCPTSTTCPTTVAITPSTPTTTYLATTQSTATKPRYILPLTESTSTKHPSKVTIITIPTPTTTCSTTTQPATHTILSLPSSPSQSELLRERGLSLKISSQLSEIKNMLLANEAARARERRQDREERRKEREMRIIEKERERREQQVFQTKLLEILSILGTERKSRPRSRSRSSRSRSRSRRSRRSSSRSKSECLVQEDESTKNVEDEGLVQEYEVFVQEDEGMAQKHESLNQEGLIQNYEGPNQEDLVQEDEGPNQEDLVQEDEGPNQEDPIQEDEGPNQEDLVQEDEGPHQEALVQKDEDEVLVQKDESPNQKDEGLVEESQGLNLRRSCRKILGSKRLRSGPSPMCNSKKSRSDAS